MTTTPDPQTVREIARRILLEAAADQDPNFYTSRTGRELWNKLRTRTGPTVDEFGAWFTAVKSAINSAIVTVSWPDGQPQDEHQAPPGHCEIALNAAYRECVHLVALLATWYPSHIGHNDPNAPDWAVVTVELATGQACWHIAPEDMDLFGHVQPTPRHARPWDGHTTAEKYARIDQLAASVAAAKGDLVMSMQAEQPQDDGDVRAVALLAAADDDEELDRAVSELISRFADRIEVLEARDAKAEPGGAT